MGGEEFVLVLPATAADRAFSVAERIRLRLTTDEVTSGAHEFHISASFGITELLPSDSNIFHLVRRSDRALYDAKQDGRNRSVINLEPDSEPHDSFDSLA